MQLTRLVWNWSSDANLAELEIKISLICGRDLSPNLRKTPVQIYLPGQLVYIVKCSLLTVSIIYLGGLPVTSFWLCLWHGMSKTSNNFLAFLTF